MDHPINGPTRPSLRIAGSVSKIVSERVEKSAQAWIDSYRKYAQKPDSLGHSDHSGAQPARPTSSVNPELIEELVALRHREIAQNAKVFRQANEHISDAIGEIATSNFMLFFRDRIRDVYIASARRDGGLGKMEDPLHEQLPLVQERVACILAEEALDFAVFMESQGAILDQPGILKMAKHSPVVYLDAKHLKEHYLDLLFEGNKPSHLRQHFFKAPRLAARNGRPLDTALAHPAFEQPKNPVRAFEALDGQGDSANTPVGSASRDHLSVVRDMNPPHDSR